MVLYLMQHGKCLSKDEDPQRPLSDRGVEETRKIAEIAHSGGISVAAVRHSGKLRAQQTAELMAVALRVDDVEKMEGLKPLDNVVNIASDIAKHKRYMLVGHLPFMSRLTSLLLTNNQEHEIVSFQNSGIVCLEYDHIWRIRWTLFPDPVISR
jgi:phosphohistidine phosphatase